VAKATASLEPLAGERALLSHNDVARGDQAREHDIDPKDCRLVHDRVSGNIEALVQEVVEKFVAGPAAVG